MTRANGRIPMSGQSSIEIDFLGGASGIGASCTLVRVAGTAFVVDCGVRYSGPSALPDLSPLADTRVDAILVTHAHMDFIPMRSNELHVPRTELAFWTLRPASAWPPAECYRAARRKATATSLPRTPTTPFCLRDIRTRNRLEEPCWNSHVPRDRRN